jgi:hypothetical protein
MGVAEKTIEGKFLGVSEEGRHHGTRDLPMLWVVFREDFEGNHAGFDDGGVWLVAKEIDWQVKIRNDALSDRERRGN